MAIDHDMHRARVKAVSDKMSHPMEYNDAGAPKLREPKIEKGFNLREQDIADRTKKLWKEGAYDKGGNYVGLGKGVKHK